MSLIGQWVDESAFHIPRKSTLTEDELYDTEKDASKGQVRYIMGLMIELGYKNISDIHGDFRVKTNGYPSIGMAGRIIDMLLKEKDEAVQTPATDTK
jgi:hypothetical protein